MARRGLLHRLFGARLLDTRLLHAWFLRSWFLSTGFLGACLLRARRFNVRLLHAGRRCGLGHGFAMHLRNRFLRLGLALHLQAVLFQLLGVDRLLGA